MRRRRSNSKKFTLRRDIISVSSSPGWDIVRIDDGLYEGFSLVDPNGNVWMETRVAQEYSPGWNLLLEEAERLVEVASKSEVWSSNEIMSDGL